MEHFNRNVILSSHGKLNRGDIDASVEDFAEEASNHGVKVGRAGIKMVLEDIYRTFPDWNFEILDMVAEGESVVIRSIVRATHLGVGALPVNGGLLIDVEPTGRSFEAQHIHWYKLRDGKIVEHYACRDDVAMMQQLGLLPAPKAFPPAAE